MRLFQISLVLAVLVAAGCGGSDGRVKLYPASGKVLVNGQPGVGARLVFYPVAQQAGKQQPPAPVGEVGADGYFRLQTFKPDDGAPTGEYKVTITWLEPPPANALGIFDQKDRLGGRYSNPEKSKLSASIKPGGGELPPFEL